MSRVWHHTDLFSAYLALIITVICLTAREVFPFVESPDIMKWLGEFLRVQFHVFLTFSAYLYVLLFHSIVFPIILTVLGMVFVFRFVQFLRDNHQFPPEFGILMGFTAVIWQFVLDISPALLLFSLFGGLWLALSLKYTGRYKFARYFVPAFMLAGIIPYTDWAEIVAAIFLAAGLILTDVLFRKTQVKRPAAVHIFFFAACSAQLMAVWLPQYRVTHYAKKFSSLGSYSFCEFRKPPVLFAAHPECSFAMSGKTCQQGFVGVYNSDTLALVDSIRIFRDDTYGRIEQIVCGGENIYLGLNGVHVNSNELGAAAVIVESAAAQKKRVLVNFAGHGVGQSMVYDEKRDALFLTAEFTNRIYRWDARKKVLQADFPPPPENSWYRPYSGLVHSGSLMTHSDAISHAANSAWFAEWINGRFAHEVDLDSYRLKRSLAVYGGAATAIMADDESSSVWVPQVWGVSVYDMKTGAVRARHRLGLMNRAPVVDPRHNLVFMSGTFSGRLYIFDRKSGRYLGKLAMGIGGRHLLYSDGTQRLYASSRAGSYYFDMNDESDFTHWLTLLKGNAP